MRRKKRVDGGYPGSILEFLCKSTLSIGEAMSIQVIQRTWNPKNTDVSVVEPGNQERRCLSIRGRDAAILCSPKSAAQSFGGVAQRRVLQEQ